MRSGATSKSSGGANEQTSKIMSQVDKNEGKVSIGVTFAKSVDDLTPKQLAEYRALQRQATNLSPVNPAKYHPLLEQPKQQNRKTLVLDIDETLVHSSYERSGKYDLHIPCCTDPVRKQYTHVYVAFRPFLRKFLEIVTQMFEVVIFAASVEIYCRPLMEHLDPQKRCALLWRDHCTNVNGLYVKDLSLLGRDLSQIAIIANRPHAYLFQPRNAIPITSWFDNPDDRELRDLIHLLKRMSNTRSVYDTLDVFNSSRKLIYPGDVLAGAPTSNVSIEITSTTSSQQHGGSNPATAVCSPQPLQQQQLASAIASSSTLTDNNSNNNNSGKSSPPGQGKHEDKTRNSDSDQEKKHTSIRKNKEKKEDSDQEVYDKEKKDDSDQEVYDKTRNSDSDQEETNRQPKSAASAAAASSHSNNNNNNNNKSSPGQGKHEDKKRNFDSDQEETHTCIRKNKEDKNDSDQEAYDKTRHSDSDQEETNRQPKSAASAAAVSSSSDNNNDNDKSPPGQGKHEDKTRNSDSDQEETHIIKNKEKKDDSDQEVYDNENLMSSTPLPSNDTPAVLIASTRSESSSTSQQYQTPNENVIITNKHGAIAAPPPSSAPAPSAATRKEPVEVWKLFPHIRVMRQDRRPGQPPEFFVHKMILDKQKAKTDLEHYYLCRNDHLRHPNLLLYKNAMQHTDGRVEINMEYANCGTLDIALGDIHPKLRQVAAKACARQIFNGAAYYYQIHNRVNRDSKLSNFFLQHNGTVKIGGFDVSRTLGSDVVDRSANIGSGSGVSSSSSGGSSKVKTKAATFSANDMGQQEQQQHNNDDNNDNNINDNAIDASLLPPIVSLEYAQVGTDAYAAPEIIEDKCRIIPQVVEPWSIGASLWTLLEGQPPFRRFKLTKFEAPKQAEHVDKLPWNEVATDPALQYLLKRCLTVDVEKRCGLVEALAITHVVQNPTNRSSTTTSTEGTGSNSSSSASASATPLATTTSTSTSCSASSSYSNLETYEQIRKAEDESWKNSFANPEGENVQIAKSFNIKLCDDILRECCCDTNDPEIDSKVKRAARAMETELHSWKVARNAACNDDKTLSAVDGCMLKIMRNERCVPVFEIMRQFAKPLVDLELLSGAGLVEKNI